MHGILSTIINFIVVYLPPMAANGAPVVFMHKRRGRPLDFGLKWIDGRRLLGDGKTIEGALIYMATGVVVSSIISLILYNNIYIKVIVTGAVASAGALMGDIVESFLKRRIGLPRGAPLPLADQLDFYIGANLALLACNYCIKPVLSSYVAGVVLIPILHVVTNKLAFKLGFKKVPW